MGFRKGDKEMEGADIIIPDASVIVKWFTYEEYSEQAINLLNDYVNEEVIILVPSLYKYEVINALRYNRYFGEYDLIEVGKALRNYQFTEVSLTRDYLESAVRIALKYGLTIYDSSYIAIAENENGMFYTADEKLLNKVRVLNYVRHIKDYNKGA